jgi:DNA-binding transcriptional MerR regulator/uncharacterized protein (DUF433 family)
MDSRDPAGELGRGAYDARRAAALAGVPQSTLHYWARKEIYRPSVSPEPRVRLWSWLDLLALRTIDWLRATKGPDEPRRVSIRKIREALGALDRQGIPRERLQDFIVVSRAGELFIELARDLTVRADASGQVTFDEILQPVKPYGRGPDLVVPRPRLRIIPGKLHGEPHILDTRIPSAAVYALIEDGYAMADIQRVYPDAAPEALFEAIDLERSLNERAA